MKQLLICIAVLLLIATTVSAVMPIPTQLSYQGRLTSSTGTPITGTKNLTFKIYDGGGAMLWMSGSVTVSCTDGLFSVILGGPGMPAITPDVLTDPSATLGITVESDPELSPRTPLTSSAFSYTALVAPLYLPLGGGTLTGDVTWDFGSRDVRVQNFGSSTALTLTGPISPAVQISSDGNGDMVLRNSTSALNVAASANSTFGGTIEIANAGGTTTHLFSSSGVGNLATVVPDNSIGAQEILDEPGIASSTSVDWLALTGVMQDLATVTLTLPAPGYVFLSGKVGELDLLGTTGSNWAWLQIDETPGATVTPPYSIAVGAGAFPSNESAISAPSLQRVYFKPAGTYTFRLEASKGGAGAGGAANAFYPTLTAMYFPTSYGSVLTVSSSGGTGEVQQGSTVSTGGVTPATGVVVSASQTIDLRELELNAAKTDAAAQKARLELLRAQMSQQSSGQTNR